MILKTAYAAPFLEKREIPKDYSHDLTQIEFQENMLKTAIAHKLSELRIDHPPGTYGSIDLGWFSFWEQGEKTFTLEKAVCIICKKPHFAEVGDCILLPQDICVPEGMDHLEIPMGTNSPYSKRMSFRPASRVKNIWKRVA